MGVKLEIFRCKVMKMKTPLGDLQAPTAWRDEEIPKMVLYLSFPVTMFWLANQANYFEDYVVTRKRQIFPPEQVDVWKEIEAQREKMRQQKYEMQNNMK